MSMIVNEEIRSVTGRNVLDMKNKFGLDPWKISPIILQKQYRYNEVPEVDSWRLPLLTYLQAQQDDMHV